MFRIIRLSHSDYTIAWICALPLEMAVAKAMLDEIHPALPTRPNDQNTYVLGTIRSHHVVVSCLPSGVYGTTSAATVAAQLLSTFPAIQFGLMVGIGGGAPTKANDIRLGDVVVSTPQGTLGGVVQYDFGKTVEEGAFQRTGALNRPPQVLLTAVSKLRADYLVEASQIPYLLAEMLVRYPHMQSGFSSPGPENDVLFDATYDHPYPDRSCHACDASRLVSRPSRTGLGPVIHYGIIASGNQVMKHGATRDQLAKELGVLCFEMEAAGLTDSLPCLVIRGICDYSDSHKNKDWQGYAAATAAAWTKALLSVIHPSQVTAPLDRAFRQHTWMIPFERNQDFVGRATHLGQLMLSIHPNTDPDCCQKTAIVGLGGVGKTQIALEAAYRLHDLDPECSIYWVPAIDSTSFEQAYHAIARELRIGGKADDKEDIKLLVKTALNQDTSHRWLMVVDSADDPELMFSRGMAGKNEVAEPLASYLPFGKKGSILFTTRNEIVARRAAKRNLVKVEPMDTTEARGLLEAKLDASLMVDPNSTLRLLDLLTNLPLAILQAAAYMNETGKTVSEYLEIYESDDMEMIYLLSREFEDFGRYDTAHNPIATTWLISFLQISKRNSLAADYLCLMSFLAEQDIPGSLLPRDGRARMADAVATLKAYAFITERKQSNSYDIHRLVQVSVRYWLKEREEWGVWATKAVQHVAAIFPDPDHENQDVWSRYLPHAQHVLDFRKDASDAAMECTLLSKVGFASQFLGKYKQATSLHYTALELRRATLGERHPLTLSSMSDAAATMRSEGKYRHAEELHRETLELRNQVLGEKHPDTLTSMNHLAIVLDDQGKYQESEQIHRQTVELMQQVLGREHPETLTSMNCLASVLYSQGRYKEAEKGYRETLRLRDKVLGKEHPDRLRTMNNLGLVLDDQAEYEEAEEIHRQNLQIISKVLGKTNPMTLGSMNNLARVLNRQGKYAEAEQMHREAIALKEEVFGNENPSTLRSRSNLAVVLFRQGKYTEAADLHSENLGLRREVVGNEHPETLVSMNGLADVFLHQGRYHEAEELYRQTVEIRERVLGKEHPLTLESVDNLVTALQSQEKHEEAERPQPA
ncbi:hypothetical protein BJX63DRAFT_386694 [Aspergillus granulosus]|uniref:Nucleoside phosphorylase domain-containing protein n=1 Tax=Aspergillus granulosus TaxID=176169 RepID=A0ABR4HN61_9EURO